MAKLHHRRTHVKNKGLFYAFILSLLFGTSLISSRFALSEFDPIDFVALRMVISVTCFATFFSLNKRHQWPTSKAVWKHGIVLGIIGTTIPFTAFISALNYLSGGIAAIIGSTAPVITLVMAHFFLRDDALTRRKVIGVTLALSGAILLTLSGETGLGDSAEFNPIGYLLIFISNISVSIGTIYTRKFVGDLDILQITSVRVFTAMLVTIPLGYLLGGLDISQVTYIGLTTLFYSAIISSFLGFILSLYIINEFGVTTSIMTNYLVPVIATSG
ncbi:MAG TPA: DMT family transporter, partial [Anaerolineae bacterium]|nr:DMT family transporter [Anaerolineae bacterium]